MISTARPFHRQSENRNIRHVIKDQTWPSAPIRLPAANYTPFRPLAAVYCCTCFSRYGFVIDFY